MSKKNEEMMDYIQYDKKKEIIQNMVDLLNQQSGFDQIDVEVNIRTSSDQPFPLTTVEMIATPKETSILRVSHNMDQT